MSRFKGKQKFFLNIGIYIFLACLIVSFSVNAQNNPESLKKSSFIAQWVPQAQFAGYYVAYEKGFYRDYGIDLNIIAGGPQRSPCEFLKQGDVDFTNLSLNTAIQAYTQGLELVNIAQIMQKSAFMLVAKKSSGIEKIEDINNKKVGVWTGISQMQALSFIEKYNLKVIIIPQTYSVNLFLSGGIDVASAMWYNEYHTILNSGYDPQELTTFFFSEYGLSFPEDGIYTLKKTFLNDPNLCCSFVKATIKGWKYAFNHQEETLDIVLKYMKAAHMPANRVHQKWMLERMKDLIMTNGQSNISGILSPGDYLRVGEELKKTKMIQAVPEFDNFYKNCASND